LVAKLGFDPNDNSEFEQGMDIYIKDLDLITSSKRKTYKFICQMHMNQDKKELDQCVADGKKANSSNLLFL